MPAAEIRFTVDGALPGWVYGTRYTAPIRIASTTRLRAVAIAAGLVSPDRRRQLHQARARPGGLHVASAYHGDRELWSRRYSAKGLELHRGRHQTSSSPNGPPGRLSIPQAGFAHCRNRRKCSAWWGSAAAAPIPPNGARSPIASRRWTKRARNVKSHPWACQTCGLGALLP